VTPNPLSLQLSNFEIMIYFTPWAHSTTVALNHGGAWHVVSPDGWSRRIRGFISRFPRSYATQKGF
jgi:hypothetical protein